MNAALIKQDRATPAPLPDIALKASLHQLLHAANSRARHSIWIAPSQPLRWMRPGWRLVLRISLAKAAEPAGGIHALLKCCKAAICAAARPTAVNRAPRIVLGLGSRHYPGSQDENCQHKNQDFHDQSPVVRRSQALTPKPQYYFTTDSENSPLGSLRPSKMTRPPTEMASSNHIGFMTTSYRACI
jgi:hypothetical protein